MAIPVSIRTKNDFLLDLCKIPLIGGFAIVLIAFGPPTLLILLGALGAWIAGFKQLFFTSFLEPSPIYIATMFALSVMWNLAAIRLWNLSIRILYIPAWAIGLIGIVTGLLMHFNPT